MIQRHPLLRRQVTKQMTRVLIVKTAHAARSLHNRQEHRSTGEIDLVDPLSGIFQQPLALEWLGGDTCSGTPLTTQGTPAQQYELTTSEADAHPTTPPATRENGGVGVGVPPCRPGCRREAEEHRAAAARSGLKVALEIIRDRWRRFPAARGLGGRVACPRAPAGSY